MENDEQPSTTGAFFRGLLSGAMSGLVMISIMAVLSPAFAAMWPALHLGGVTMASAAFMVSVTSLFGGVMNAAKTFMHRDSPSPYVMQRASESPEILPVITPSMSPDLAPTVAPSAGAASPDVAEEAAPRPNWVDRTNGGDNKNRIQEILSNGAMSDKSRAEAILAMREQSAAEGKPLA